MADPRWTEDTEHAVALAAYRDWTGERGDFDGGHPLLRSTVAGRWHQIARAALTALADAGLLLTPGNPAGADPVTYHGHGTWRYDCPDCGRDSLGWVTKELADAMYEHHRQTKHAEQPEGVGIDA